MQNISETLLCLEGKRSVRFVHTVLSTLMILYSIRPPELVSFVKTKSQLKKL